MKAFDPQPTAVDLDAHVRWAHEARSTMIAMIARRVWQALTRRHAAGAPSSYDSAIAARG